MKTLELDGGDILIDKGMVCIVDIENLTDVKLEDILSKKYPETEGYEQEIDGNFMSITLLIRLSKYFGFYKGELEKIMQQCMLSKWFDVVSF